MGKRTKLHSLMHVGFVAAIFFGALIFLPHALAESHTITIYNVEYKEITSEFSVSASFGGFSSVNDNWQVLLTVHDSTGLSSAEFISFSLNDQKNFEVISFDSLGSVMIENVSLDIENGSLVVNSFVIGYEQSDELKVGLLLRNDSGQQSALDFALVNPGSSNVSENPSCGQLREMIDMSVIPSEVGDEILLKAGC